jgi:5'-3' exonuclease
MPPEITIALLGILAAVSAGIAKLITATVDRRVKQMNEDAEELRKKREQSRNIEMEQMRQKTAVAQAAADQAQAVGENLINLNATIIKLIENNTAENHANRGVLTNQAESIGDLDTTIGKLDANIDKLAEVVSDGSVITRATGKKADEVVTAVNRLYDRFALLFPTDKPAVEQIRDGLIEVVNKVYEAKKTDSQEIKVITPPDLPKASGE